MQSHVYSKSGSTLLGTPYRLAFFIWRRLPSPIRAISYTNPLARSAKEIGRQFLARFAGRDDLYNKEYYRANDREQIRSAQAIVNSTITEFTPRTLLDVGCGTGALLAAFQTAGVATLGLEYSKAATKICLERGLDVRSFDIENDPLPDAHTDLATCFEVAEHIGAEFADRLVEILVQSAPVVIFSAATPGQGGGVDHVNEQPNDYWIAKFDKRGHNFLPDLTARWRAEWKDANAAAYYASNVMVFKSAQSRRPTAGSKTGGR